MKRFLRGAAILWVVFRFGLDGLLLDSFNKPWLRMISRIVSIGRNLDAPRGQRLREALESLGVAGEETEMLVRGVRRTDYALVREKGDQKS